MIKELQFEINLEIVQILLDSVPKGSVSICWSGKSSKSKSIQTKKSIQISRPKVWHDFGQRLGINTVCKWSNKKFAPKQYDIKVMVDSGRGKQLYGQISIDLSSLLIGDNYVMPVTRTREEYLKRSGGKINYNISAKFVKQCDSSLNTTTVDFHNTRPISRQSQNSAQFSFQMHSTGRDFRQSYQQKMLPQNQISSQFNDQANFFQLIQLRRNFDKKNQQVLQLQKQLNQARERINALQGSQNQRDLNMMNQVNLLRNQNTSFRRQIEQLNYKVSRGREDQIKIEQYSRRIQELQGQNLRKYNQYIAIQNRNSNKIKDLHAINEKANEQNMILTSELQKLSLRLKQLDVTKQQQDKKVTEQRRIFDQKIRSLQEKLKEKQTDFQKLKIQFDISSTQRNNISMMEKQYKFEIQQKMVIIKKLESQNSSMKALGMQMQSQYYQFKQKIHSSQKQYLNKINELEEGLAKKQSDLEQRRNIIDKAKEYIEQKDNEIRQRNNFIMQAKQYVYQKEKELNQATQNSEKFKLQSKQKDIIILKLKQETVSLNERLRVSLQQGNSQRQQIQIKEKYLSEYLSDLAAETSRNSEMEEQLQHLRSELEQQKQQSVAKQEQLKFKLSDLVKQNVEYKLELAKAHNQLKRIYEKGQFR